MMNMNYKNREFSRDEAIRMNRHKCENPLLTYSQEKGNIWAKNTTFISKNTKTANTNTFIRQYSNDIAEANIKIQEENNRKQRIKEYKKRISAWSLAIDERINQRRFSKIVI